jgi:hypothetical protein
VRSCSNEPRSLVQTFAARQRFGLDWGTGEAGKVRGQLSAVRAVQLKLPERRGPDEAVDGGPICMVSHLAPLPSCSLRPFHSEFARSARRLDTLRVTS